MWREEWHKDKFKLEHPHPDDFTRSFWQKQPRALPIWIAFRVFLILFFFVIFVWMLIFKPEWSTNFVWYKNLLYISTWNTYLQCVVFAIALIITVIQFMKEKKNPQLPPMEKMPWHYKLLWFLYSVAASTGLVNSTMFWFFVYSPDIDTNLFFAITCKFFNTFFMLLDFFLYAIPYRFLHFYMPITFPVVYLLFSVTYQLNGGTGNNGQIPIYDVFDWRKPGKAFVFFIIFLACSLLSHCGLCTINLVKHWLKKPNE